MILEEDYCRYGQDSMSVTIIVVRYHERVFPAHTHRYRSTIPYYPLSIVTPEELVRIVRHRQPLVAPSPAHYLSLYGGSDWASPERSSGIKPPWLSARPAATYACTLSTHLNIVHRDMGTSAKRNMPVHY